MVVTHLVLFKFKPGVSPEVIRETCAEIISLKDNCIHAETQKPYIKQYCGGKDNSPEGFQHRMTHAFVAEFESAADRDYYVASDPAHLALQKGLQVVVEKVLVLDFSDGYV